MSELEINKELVLSSSHIPEDTARQLEQLNYSSDQNNTRTLVDGFLRDIECIHLAKLLGLAGGLDCKWLVLDCDCPVIDTLETFDW